jgi:hypothetical protein
MVQYRKLYFAAIPQFNQGSFYLKNTFENKGKVVALPPIIAR